MRLDVIYFYQALLARGGYYIMAEQLTFELPAPSDYLQERNGNIYITATRVTLASIVLLWRQGMAAEAIQADFPSVSLASVYGAIAYYLDHQSTIDQYLDTLTERQRTLETRAEATHPQLYAQLRQRMAEARRDVVTQHDDTIAPQNERVSRTVESPTA